MSSSDAKPSAGLRERFIHELKQYLFISLFLFFFFGSFTMYRRLVLAEYEIGYLDYGWALIKALVLGKVILIGEILHLGERFEDRPLLISTFWKTFMFGLLILAFAVLERVVGALITTAPSRRNFSSPGRDTSCWRGPICRSWPSSHCSRSGSWGGSSARESSRHSSSGDRAPRL